MLNGVVSDATRNKGAASGGAGIGAFAGATNCSRCSRAPHESMYSPSNTDRASAAWSARSPTTAVSDGPCVRAGSADSGGCTNEGRPLPAESRTIGEDQELSPLQWLRARRTPLLMSLDTG